MSEKGHLKLRHEDAWVGGGAKEKAQPLALSLGHLIKVALMTTGISHVQHDLNVPI